jgi:PAS domain S-box-containing protein
MDQALHILILEDNAADAALTQRELRKAGLQFTADVAYNQASYLNALDAHAPDLILADYSLPGFDGLAAVTLARQRFASVPIIIVSGAIGEETAVEALRAGATDYVLKQRLSRLAPVVQRALAEAEQLRQKKRTEEALRQSEEQLRLLIDGVQDYAIFMLDLEGRVVNWTSGAQRVKLWSADEIVGRHFSAFYPPGDVAAGKPQRELATAIRDGRYEEEGRRLRRDGSIFWARVTITPVHDPQGKPRGFVKVVRDITDRKAAEDELRAAKLTAERAKAAAEEASRAKDQFLAVLSHELRTPLAPVVAAVSMLQQQWNCDQASRETLEMIRRNVELEARLIDDLLDVTRITRGKLELDRQPVQLCDVIRRAVEVCLPDIEARRLDFGVDIGPESPYIIHADPARLQQVFWNLLKNAIKFTPHGGCVGIRCRRDRDGHVITEVNDSGEGIEPEMLPRIFNPFEQGGTRVTRQFGGLGLGLTITRGLVEMHGGSIEAHSDGKGKGSSFRVKLPLYSAAALASAGPQAQPRAPAPRQIAPLRILVVEDHGDTARIMRRLLTMQGHHVHTAGDVATALELTVAHSFDLLISDLGLPDGSGIDLLHALRQRGHTFPAIALSGYGQDQDLQRTRDAGFAAHLTKPVSLDRLSSTIANATAKQPAPNWPKSA